MSNNIIIVSENVAIVESGDATSERVADIGVQDYETVSLAIAQSKPIIEDQYVNIRLSFGAWVESGDEDLQLKELYESRLTPSCPIDE
jgi:hypothetical protein